MKNGIYGIASLNGSPLKRGDLATILFGSDRSASRDDSCAMHVEDSQLSAIHFARTHDGICALLGHLDEPQDVADMLGVDRDTQNTKLVALANDRWGADMATKLLGEWLMVRWHSAARRLTIVTAECIRDHCYFATDGAAVAFSPELPRLARLSWTTTEFDPEVLLRSMGTYTMREGMNGRSILKGVLVLRAGEQVIIDATGIQRCRAAPVMAAPLRRIGFSDAIVELRETLDKVLTQQLRRSGDAAFLLSGGLDSSLLAGFGAGALPSAAQMFLLTSTAPANSQLEDEAYWAAMVSDHLELPMIPVTPAGDCDIYKPGGRTFKAFETPLQSPRHYLYEALEDAALERGCSALVDGMFGELTVSYDNSFDRPAGRTFSWRKLARSVRDAIGSSSALNSDNQFLVRLSPAVTADHLHQCSEPMVKPYQASHDGAFGIQHGAMKSAGQPTNCSVPALRCIYPFRDRRLIRLMGAYPVSFAAYDGKPRAPARHMMRGRLPRAVIERTSKLGFSPTHDLLLRKHAHHALARLVEDPVEDAYQWLDLDWLKTQLVRVVAGGNLSSAHATELQNSAIALEFFRWWRDEALHAPR